MTQTRSLPVLVFHIGSLGDTLASIPGLKAIRAAYPDSPIHFLYDVQPDQRASAADIVRPLGLADEFIPWIADKSPATRFRSQFALAGRLRRTKYAEAICLLPSEREASRLQRDRLFFHLCGIHRMPTFRPVEYALEDPTKEAERRLARLDFAGIRRLPEAGYYIELPRAMTERVDNWLKEQRRHADKPLIAICPGAKKQACHWTLDNFRSVGSELLKSIDCELAILGGPEVQDDAAGLAETWGHAVNGVGQFSVLETAAVLHRCALLVGLDTGTTHLAAAVGTKCVALFSEQERSRKWEPMGQGHHVIRHTVPCRGCKSTECIVPGHPCMRGITVAEVLSHVRVALGGRG